MIEILIMVFGVLPWFYRTAKTHRRNPFGWVVIGAVSYYVPVIAMGRIILPAVLEGEVTRDNLIAMVLLSMAASVAAGVGGCLIARRALLAGSSLSADADLEAAIAGADPISSSKAAVQPEYVSLAGQEGTAFCLGCRREVPKGVLFYNKTNDIYYHRECLPPDGRVSRTEEASVP